MAVCDERIDDLLADWHTYCTAYRLGAGYPRSAPGADMATIAKHYDGDNGAQDAAAWRSTMEAVDAAIHRIPQPWLTALQFEARNLHSVAECWLSPRLPRESADRRVMVDTARALLKKELASSGVLS